MSTTGKIIKYQISDALRSKWLFLYTILLFSITYGLFRFSGDLPKVLLSITNITLILVPLISLLFGAIFLYGSEEFIEFLLAQPVGRKAIFRGLFLGTILPLSGCYLLGVGLPLFAYGVPQAHSIIPLIDLLFVGIGLTVGCIAVAFFISLSTRDRARGLGYAVMVWILFSVLYDGIVLLLVLAFQEYPIERGLLVMSFLNPIDLCRILMLMQLDVSALMGYTGALFERSFGGIAGQFLLFATILIWISASYLVSATIFRKKDF